MTAKIARVWDCETSGLPEDDTAELLEVGFIDIDLTGPDFPLIEASAYTSLIKPVGDIPPQTMAVHHITPDEVSDAPVAATVLLALADGVTPGDVYVAHNASFEAHFFPAQGFKWVDTLKCAYRAWPDAPGHSNQVLRYWLGLDLDRHLAMPPHWAFPDAYVTAHILQKLLALRPVERLIEISGQPGFLPKFNFGKYRGKTFKEVAEIDRGYLTWIVEKSDMDADVKFTSKWWLQKGSAS